MKILLKTCAVVVVVGLLFVGGYLAWKKTSSQAPATHTLTVQSLPEAGATIIVSPADKDNKSNGETLFSRVYSKGAEVTLTAPENFEGNKFSKWLINGADRTDRNTRIPMNADSSAIAVFAPVADTGSATHTLTVQSLPEAGATIIVSPADKDNKSNGETLFSRVYSKGAEVTLTAPENFEGNKFSKWLINGADRTDRNTRIPMNADATAIAVFQQTVGRVEDLLDAALKANLSDQEKIKLIFKKGKKQIIFGVDDVPEDEDDTTTGRQKRSLMAQRYAQEFWGEEYKHLYPSKEEFQKMNSRALELEKSVKEDLTPRISGLEREMKDIKETSLPAMQRNIVKEVAEETRKLLAPPAPPVLQSKVEKRDPCEEMLKLLIEMNKEQRQFRGDFTKFFEKLPISPPAQPKQPSAAPPAYGTGTPHPK